MLFQKNKIMQSVAMSIIINGFIPILVYKVMLLHFSDFVSLIAATIIPLFDSLYSILKLRKVDVFALIMLTGFTLSIIAVFLGGNGRLILLRESFVSGILGMLFILSVALPRPIIFFLAKKFMASGDVEKEALLEDNWHYPYFRFSFRLLTIVWGLAFVGEALIKVYLVYHISTVAFLAVSQFVFYGALGFAIAFNVIYQRHIKSNMIKIKANMNLIT